MNIARSIQVLVQRLTGVDYTQSDKVAHSWLGAAVSAISLLVVDRLPVHHHWYVLLIAGIGTAAVVGALKEWSDYYHPAIHTCDILDFVATTLGSVPVSLIFCFWKCCPA